MCFEPGRTIRPETCWGAEESATCNSSRPARLHIELPKVFGTQVLEVFLQLLGGHFVRRLGQSFGRGLAVFEEERSQKTFLRVDRRLEPQRNRDAVRRTGIDVNCA